MGEDIGDDVRTDQESDPQEDPANQEYDGMHGPSPISQEKGRKIDGVVFHQLTRVNGVLGRENHEHGPKNDETKLQLTAECTPESRPKTSAYAYQGRAYGQTLWHQETGECVEQPSQTQANSNAETGLVFCSQRVSIRST